MEVSMQVSKVSPVRAIGHENDAFLARMTRAQEQGRFESSYGEALDGMLRRGRARRTSRTRSLSELDGDRD